MFTNIFDLYKVTNIRIFPFLGYRKDKIMFMNFSNAKLVTVYTIYIYIYKYVIKYM
jgi:hypothetical protein